LVGKKTGNHLLERKELHVPVFRRGIKRVSAKKNVGEEACRKGEDLRPRRGGSAEGEVGFMKNSVDVLSAIIQGGKSGNAQEERSGEQTSA